MGNEKNDLLHDDDVRSLPMSVRSIADRHSFTAFAEVIAVAAEGSPIATLVEGSFAVSSRSVAVSPRSVATHSPRGSLCFTERVRHVSGHRRKSSSLLAATSSSKKSKGPPQTKCCPKFCRRLSRFSAPTNLLCPRRLVSRSLRSCTLPE